MKTAEIRDTRIDTPVTGGTLYYVFVFLTVVLAVARVGELMPEALIPIVKKLRPALVLYTITLTMFFFGGHYRNVSWRGNAELKMMVSLLVLAVVLLPFSFWKGHSIRACVLILGINLMLFLFLQSSVFSRSRFTGAIKVVIVSSLLLVAGLIVFPHVEQGRVSTTYTYDSNDIALLFGFAFPLVLSFFITSTWKGKLLSLAIMTGLVFGMVRTGSRGGMVAFGLSVLLIFFSSKIHLKMVYKIAVVAVIVALFLSPAASGLRERFGTLFAGRDYNITAAESSHAGGRLAIWRSGLHLFVHHPLTGVGMSNSAAAMMDVFGSHSWKEMHNAYLQILVELGVAGLAIFLGMLWRIFSNCVQAKRALLEVENRGESDAELILLESFTTAFQIALITYMAAAFFLSQAYSMAVPLMLAFTSQLRRIAEQRVAGGPVQAAARRPSGFIPPAQRRQLEVAAQQPVRGGFVPPAQRRR